MGKHAGLVCYRDAEVAAAWAAVVFDHVRAVVLTQHHERDTAGGAHGLPLHHSTGAAHQLQTHRNSTQEMTDHCSTPSIIIFHFL